MSSNLVPPVVAASPVPPTFFGATTGTNPPGVTYTNRAPGQEITPKAPCSHPCHFKSGCVETRDDGLSYFMDTTICVTHECPINPGFYAPRGPKKSVC